MKLLVCFFIYIFEKSTLKISSLKTVLTYYCQLSIRPHDTYSLEKKDKKLINSLLFVDFKKAFDMIDGRFLLKKLNEYYFMNNAIMIIESYYTNRKNWLK